MQGEIKSRPTILRRLGPESLGKRKSSRKMTVQAYLTTHSVKPSPTIRKVNQACPKSYPKLRILRRELP
jgi:hypothetical protein